MKEHDVPAPRFRRHHVILAVVAILTAIALAANYYLW
jgi:hypothetical protein